MKTLKLLLTCIPLCLVLPARAAVVYENLSGPVSPSANGLLATPTGSNYYDIADDVTLGAGPRVFESLTVAYRSLLASDLTLTLYGMDGPPTPLSFGFNTPGTVLFQSTVSVAATLGNTVTVIDASGTVTLPDFVAIGLRFDPAGVNGPLVFDPPTVGSSAPDIWLRELSTDPWGLFNYSTAANIGARITAVGSTIPDAGSSLLLAWIVLTAAVLGKRVMRSAPARPNPPIADR